MTKKPIRPTPKFFATEDGETTPRRDEVANEFLWAHRAWPTENALDLFPEEVAPSSGVAPAPSGAGSRFAWPPQDEEWMPVAPVPPVAAEPNPGAGWMREVGPIAAILFVFIMIGLAVGTWIVRDIRTTRAAPAGNAMPSHAAARGTAPPAAAERGNAVSESHLPAAVMAPAAATSVAGMTISPDEDAVRWVLGRYRAAYSELDPYVARQVWPTVDMKALSRAFDQLSSQSLEFNQCRVSIIAAAAVAACDGTAWYVPKVGSRAAKTEARRLRFDLHKGDRGWTIDSVSSL